MRTILWMLFMAAPLRAQAPVNLPICLYPSVCPSNLPGSAVVLTPAGILPRLDGSLLYNLTGGGGGGGSTVAVNAAHLSGDGSAGNPLDINTSGAGGVTAQGNVFNGATQLVQTGADGKLASSVYGAIPAASVPLSTTAARLAEVAVATTTEAALRAAGDAALGLSTAATNSRADQVAVSTTSQAADISTLYAVKASTGNNGDILSISAPTHRSTFSVQGNAFSVGGSTLIVKGGLVGVGLTTPHASLDVATPDGDDPGMCVHTNNGGCNGQGGTPSGQLMMRPNSGGKFQYFVGNPGGAAWYIVDNNFATVEPFGIQLDRMGIFPVGADANVSNFFEASPNNPSDTQVAFTISKSSNVGIGNRHPGTKLHMSSGTFLMDGIRPKISVSSSNPSSELTVNGYGYFSRGIGLGVDPNGAIDNGGMTLTGQLSSSSGGNAFQFTDPTARLVWDGNTGPGFAFYDRETGLDALRLKYNPALGAETVGIGTANAAAKLHVSSGTVLVDGNQTDAIVAYGHLVSSGATPSVSSCGAGALIDGTDTAGYFNPGTIPGTACVVTFAAAYAGKAPICFCNDETTNIAVRVSNASTAGFNCNGAFISSDRVTYFCIEGR